MTEPTTRRCEVCDDPVDLHWRTRPDARYCSDACKQRAYRARKKASETVDAATIVGKWFAWYPDNIRWLLLRGENAAQWGKWLVAYMTDDDCIIRAGPVNKDDVVHVRGGPDGWVWREVPLAQFLREANPVDP